MERTYLIRVVNGVRITVKVMILSFRVLHLFQPWSPMIVCFLIRFTNLRFTIFLRKTSPQLHKLQNLQHLNSCLVVREGFSEEETFWLIPLG